MPCGDLEKKLGFEKLLAVPRVSLTQATASVVTPTQVTAHMLDTVVVQNMCENVSTSGFPFHSKLQRFL